MAEKPAQIKKPKKKDKGLRTADSVNYPTDFELSSIGEKKGLPLKKSPNMYADVYVGEIEDDKEKTKTARKRSSMSRLEEIEKMQYKNADFNTKGKKVKEIAKIAEQNKKNKAFGLKIARDRLKQKNKPYAKKQQSAKAMDTGSIFAKGGRAGYKHAGKVGSMAKPKSGLGQEARKRKNDLKIKIGEEGPANKYDKTFTLKMAKGGRAGYSVGGRAMRGVSKILMKK